jgi:hypothetical protein
MRSSHALRDSQNHGVTKSDQQKRCESSQKRCENRIFLKKTIIHFLNISLNNFQDHAFIVLFE